MKFGKLSLFNTVFINLVILLDTSTFVHALNDTEAMYVYIHVRTAPSLVSVSTNTIFSMVLGSAKMLYKYQVLTRC